MLPALSYIIESWMYEEDYVENYRKLEQYGQAIQDQYVEIILLDCICLNADRHTFNYGLLRDPNTGKVVSMAPNFDNNISMIATGYLSAPRKPDLFGTLLRELEKETNAVSGYVSRHPIPSVTHELIDQCIDEIGMDVDRSYIHQFVMAGYEQTPLPKLLSKNT